MNDVILKGAFKMLKNFISPAQMKQMGISLLKDAVNYKNSLKMAEGETQAAAMAWDYKGEVFMSIVYLDSEDRIVRYEKVLMADEVIENLINKM